MEITKEDADLIIDWAYIADMESLFSDETNLIGRIKEAFPSIVSSESILHSGIINTGG